MSSDEVTTTEVTRMEPPSQDMTLALPEAKARADLMKAILPQLVAVCYDNNILSMGKGDDNKPYINNDGCQKIARISGISFGVPRVTVSYEDMPPEPDTTYQNGGVRKGRPARRAYIVEIEGEASLLGQTITEFGGASSEDKWFDRPHESPVETRLEVRKKAMANWQGRCVRTLLGLQGLSWDDLKKVGFEPGKGGTVDYREGRRSGSDKADAKEATSDVKGKIQAQIMEDVGGNQKAFEFVLSELTGFQGDKGWVNGKKDVALLTDKWAFRLWSEIKPDGKKRDEYQDKVFLAMENFGERKPKDSDEIPF